MRKENVIKITKDIKIGKTILEKGDFLIIEDKLSLDKLQHLTETVNEEEIVNKKKTTDRVSDFLRYYPTLFNR